MMKEIVVLDFVVVLLIVVDDDGLVVVGLVFVIVGAVDHFHFVNVEMMIL